MKKLLPLFMMMRPLNGAIAVLTLIPALAVASGRLQFPIRVAFATFFFTSFGYVINDLYDFRADKINKPTRPFPSRKVSAWEGINTALLCLVLGVVALAGSELSVWIFFILLVACLFLYSFRISSMLLLSNVWVALLCSSAFVLGGLLAHSKSERIGLIVLSVALTFTFHLGREIIKDIEDIAGDRQIGRNSIPIAWGANAAKILSAIAYLATAILSYVAYWLYSLPFSFFLVVTLAVNVPIAVVFARWVFSKDERGIRKASVALKIIMVPALIAIGIAGIGMK